MSRPTPVLSSRRPPSASPQDVMEEIIAAEIDDEADRDLLEVADAAVHAKVVLTSPGQAAQTLNPVTTAKHRRGESVIGCMSGQRCVVAALIRRAGVLQSEAPDIACPLTRCVDDTARLMARMTCACAAAGQTYTPT